MATGKKSADGLGGRFGDHQTRSLFGINEQPQESWTNRNPSLTTSLVLVFHVCFSFSQQRHHSLRTVHPCSCGRHP